MFFERHAVGGEYGASWKAGWTHLLKNEICSNCSKVVSSSPRLGKTMGLQVIHTYFFWRCKGCSSLDCLAESGTVWSWPVIRLLAKERQGVSICFKLVKIACVSKDALETRS